MCMALLVKFVKTLKVMLLKIGQRNIQCKQHKLRLFYTQKKGRQNNDQARAKYKGNECSSYFLYGLLTLDPVAFL